MKIKLIIFIFVVLTQTSFSQIIKDDNLMFSDKFHEVLILNYQVWSKYGIGNENKISDYLITKDSVYLITFLQINEKCNSYYDENFNETPYCIQKRMSKKYFLDSTKFSPNFIDITGASKYDISIIKKEKQIDSTNCGVEISYITFFSSMIYENNDTIVLDTNYLSYYTDFNIVNKDIYERLEIIKPLKIYQFKNTKLYLLEIKVVGNTRRVCVELENKNIYSEIETYNLIKLIEVKSIPLR